ncbi:MAG: phytanoyl-CoA dioxygenase family protein [Gammaproteobacteria bacterium]|nr:phytanoyl-CoA dioxygenase family protein [Gammaproteobacteria bacterium]
MSVNEMTLQTLEARDLARDTQAMRERIEQFRDRLPASNPALIIDPARAPDSNAQGSTAQGGSIPHIERDELNAQVLRAAVLEHGALLVRNFFPEALIQALPHMIDRVLECVELPRKQKRQLRSHYYNPPDNLVSIMPEGAMELGALRVFNAKVGAAMCAEAPSVAEALLELFDAVELKRLISEYLNEAPCLSVKKWVIRRSALPVDEAGWHQDGAFMGTNINSINLWMPLTTCGGDTGAPGMDVVPQRLYDVASAQGASFDWSVSDDHVNTAFAMNQPVAPVFHAGDAFFFDHLYLHRTQFRKDFTRPRYAIESWFFGASAFSKSQVPLAW